MAHHCKISARGYQTCATLEIEFFPNVLILMSSTTSKNLKQTRLEGFLSSSCNNKKKANVKLTKKSNSSRKNISSTEFYNDRLLEKIVKIKEKKETVVDERNPGAENENEQKSDGGYVVATDYEKTGKEKNVDHDRTNDVCLNILCKNEVSN